ARLVHLAGDEPGLAPPVDKDRLVAPDALGIERHDHHAHALVALDELGREPDVVSLHGCPSCSAMVRVRSMTTSPVCWVVTGSTSTIQHSSSATGLCRVPRGTTCRSPGPRSTCRPPSYSMRRRPRT